MESCVRNSRLFGFTASVSFCKDWTVAFQVRCFHNSRTGRAERRENVSPGIDISLALSGFPFQAHFKSKPVLPQWSVVRRVCGGEQVEEMMGDLPGRNEKACVLSPIVHICRHHQAVAVVVRKSWGWGWKKYRGSHSSLHYVSPASFCSRRPVGSVEFWGHNLG